MVVPSGVVVRVVPSRDQHLEVFDSIVGRVAVDVVNLFESTQDPSEMVAHKGPVEVLPAGGVGVGVADAEGDSRSLSSVSSKQRVTVQRLGDDARVRVDEEARTGSREGQAFGDRATAGTALPAVALRFEGARGVGGVTTSGAWEVEDHS